MEYVHLGRPGHKVSQMCLETMTFGHEADEAVSQGRHPEGPPHEASNVAELLARRARLHGDRIAFVSASGETLTYRSWHERANAVARGLAGRGIGRGDRVGLACPSWPDHAVGYFGVLRAGAVCAPLPGDLTEAETTAALESLRVLALVGIDSPEARVRGFTMTLRDLIAGQSGQDLNVVAGAEDLADILLTSGTTGIPRGVVSTHASLHLASRSAPATWEGWTIVHVLPPHSAAGTQGAMLMQLGAGMTAVVADPTDPDSVGASVERHAASLLYLLPATMAALAEVGTVDRFDFDSLRLVFYTGGMVPMQAVRNLQAQLPRARIVSIYGLTEAGSAQLLMPYDPRRPNSVGRAVGQTEVVIADERGQPVAHGRTGEIWLRRRGIPSRFYVADAAGSAATWRDGWVLSGDLGYMDSDGYVYLVDRKKDIIIRGGQNVAPSEVERSLLEHPAVVEACVFAVEHRLWGEEVVAAVRLRQPARADDLRHFLLQRLSSWKMPRRFVQVEEVPRSGTGKPLRRRLAEMWTAGRLDLMR